MVSAETVVIESRRFGRIEVDAAQVIHLPGLPGFPQARRFVLCGHDRGDAFGWLISVDIEDLAFVVADPWVWFPDYVADLDSRHLRSLGVDSATALEALVIATISADGVTLNLAAPLLVNPQTRSGQQVILERGEYGTRESIPKPEVTSSTP